jgi:uncharacterized protein YjbI with pentapeptide repeats
MTWAEHHTKLRHLLQSGVQRWNEWRSANPTVRIVVPRIDVSGGDLRGVNLSSVYFPWGNFQNTDLGGANLAVGSFPAGNFRGANLEGVDMVDASFTGCNLDEADLCSAELSKAEFRNASLRGCNLEGALLSETIFINADLSGCLGFPTIQYAGPCTVDHRTVARSEGLTDDFLMNVGIPQDIRAVLMQQTDHGLDGSSCFLSYGSPDERFATRLRDDLRSRGVKVWFAPMDLSIGQRIRQGIEEAIRSHDHLLVLLSEASLKSAWVESEVEAALERERKEGRTVVVPLAIDRGVFSSPQAWASELRRTHHIGDFSETHQYNRSLQALLRTLETYSGRGRGKEGDVD